MHALPAVPWLTLLDFIWPAPTLTVCSLHRTQLPIDEALCPAQKELLVEYGKQLR